MKTFKEFINEMANVPAQGHGFKNIKFHILQPGQRKLSHGPRIKVFAAMNPHSFYTITMKGKLVKTPSKEFLSDKLLNNIIQHIMTNEGEYLRLWHNPYLDWTDLNLQ